MGQVRHRQQGRLLPMMTATGVLHPPVLVLATRARGPLPLGSPESAFPVDWI